MLMWLTTYAPNIVEKCYISFLFFLKEGVEGYGEDLCPSVGLNYVTKKKCLNNSLLNHSSGEFYI